MSRAWTLFIAVALLTVSCGPQPTVPGGSFDPIRIGVVVPLSGSLGTDGPGWRDAARLAALEINAAGGPLPGRPIELVVLDSETNPSRAEAVARRLVEDEEVVAVIGAAASSISLGIAQVTTPAQVPQISCCSTSDLLTQFNADLPVEDRYFFRTSPADILQSQVVAIAAEDLGCTGMAILHLDDSYGQPFGEAIESAYVARGGNVVVRVPFTDDQPSYATEVQMVADAAPDCIAMVAFPVSAANIIRDWDALSTAPAVRWIGTDGVRAPGFVDEVVEPRLIAGFYGTSPVTDAPTAAYAAFAEHYAAVFGSEPIPFSANQYDAVALIALAIAQAGTTDGPAVRDALREVSTLEVDDAQVRAGQLADGLSLVRQMRGGINYQGASGNTDFNDLGDVVTPYEIWRYDPPSATPCASSTLIAGGEKGSFCRYRTINAEDIGG